MSSVSEQYTRIASGAEALFAQRLGAAQPVEMLSNRDGKTLELMQEPDGRQFVLRTYSPDAIWELENPFFGGRLLLDDAWAAMQNMYKQADVAVVPSQLLPGTSENGSRMVVSEYLPEITPIKDASLIAKQTAVGGLAKLLNGSRYLPSSQAIISDMFVVLKESDTPVIVDVDPRVVELDNFFSTTRSYYPLYLQIFGGLIETWTDADERPAVAGAFLRSLPNAVFKIDGAMMAVSDIHVMTQSF